MKHRVVSPVERYWKFTSGGMLTDRPGDTGTAADGPGRAVSSHRASSPTPDVKYQISWIHLLKVALLVAPVGSSQ
jgi:hypothetical protein